MAFIRRNAMVNTIFAIRGNARACIYTEPMWGIPYNLYVPYVALYMAALGVSKGQMGLLSTISFVVQFVFSVLSGALTDRLGRRVCTLIFDLLSWSVPLLFWTFARNFYWFAAAAAFNGVWRVTMTSWSCLLVEDADHDALVWIYSLMHVAGQIATFFAFIAAFFVDHYGVVSTMRALYAFAFIMMTGKFVLLFFLSEETSIGKVRMREARDKRLSQLAREFAEVLRQICKTPRMLLTIVFLALLSMISTINGNYWALYLKETLLIPESALSYFAMFKSAIMLVCFFVIVPRVSAARFQRPMLWGWALLIVSQALLLLTPPGWAMYLLWVSIAMEAFAFAILNPLSDSMVILNVDPEDRARVHGMLYAVMILLVAPFPWLIGMLAQMNTRFAFGINLLLFAAGIAVTFLFTRVSRPAGAIKQAA